jgi:hypothetical protein
MYGKLLKNGGREGIRESNGREGVELTKGRILTVGIHRGTPLDINLEINKRQDLE